MAKKNKVTLVFEKGGAGSGHRGHSGRPGKVGGSMPGGSGSGDTGRSFSPIGESPVRLSLETATGVKTTVWTNERPTKDNTDTLKWVKVVPFGNAVQEGTGHDFKIGMMDLSNLNMNTVKHRQFSSASNLTKYLRETHGVELHN